MELPPRQPLLQPGFVDPQGDPRSGRQEAPVSSGASGEPRPAFSQDGRPEKGI
jgi:hypothetical protein